MTKLRLLIVGHERFTVDAIDFALSHAGGFSVLGIVGADAEIDREVRQTAPDLVVVDGVSDLAQALEWLPIIRSAALTALVLLVADDLERAAAARSLDDEVMVCARPFAVGRRDGARRQSPVPDRPLRAVAPIADARATLTNRELETLAWVAAGHKNAWIARRLWVTEQTVKFHLTNIYRKLGVANRTEASRYAIEHDLVPAIGDEPAPPVVTAGGRGPKSASAVPG